MCHLGPFEQRSPRDTRPEEALANIREAAELYIEDLIEAGDRIPDDRDNGTIVIPAPVAVC